MFEKGGYDTWQIRMLLYIEGKENVHMLLDSLLLGPFKVKEITIPANEAIGHAEEKRMQTLADLTPDNKTIMGYDIKLADEFDRFTFEREETIQSYYMRFAKLINDINIIGLHVTKLQINIKFVNQLQPEWSRFITRVKQARNLHEVSYDQLRIHYFPRLRKDQDHFLTLKNTPYPHQQIRRIRYFGQHSEETRFTANTMYPEEPIRRIQWRFMNFPESNNRRAHAKLSQYAAILEAKKVLQVPQFNRKTLVISILRYKRSWTLSCGLCENLICDLELSGDHQPNPISDHHLVIFRRLVVPVTPEVGAAVVASPAGVLELDTHSSSEVDPLESSPPPVYVAPMVLPFLCLDDSESDTEIPERHVSPTTSTPEIPTTPILPTPSTIVAPSSKFPVIHVVAPPGTHRQRAILIRPGEDIPIGRLYRTHPCGPCRALTARNSVRPLPSHRLALRYTSHHLDHLTSGSSSSHSSSDHSSSRHSILGHSLSEHTPPDTTDTDSSTTIEFWFIHQLDRTPLCSEAYL
ncbi:hypothetical protein Tco_0628018 [Tanacetum coccineum]|uniref:Uncharacterized protein n=1 Tax=Tanacetum coccineum TaxID=301880 RepID=A0ABQ4WP31_9ASTR